MRLSALLSALPGAVVPSLPDVEATGIANNSRLLLPGELFVAVPGRHLDGHRYAADAAARGACAVVGELPGLALPGKVPYVRVPDSRAALSALAAAYFSHPARKLRVVGVTGTDGKTTTATFTRALLSRAGRGAGMITTLGATIGNELFDTGPHVTTPWPFELHALLARMVGNGDAYAVLEATSHGLVEGRVLDASFDVAVVTNVTHEHLDFHGSPEAYLEAKALLFRSLAEGPAAKAGVPKVAVLNRDDPSFERLRGIRADVTLTYGLAQPADFGAEKIVHTGEGTTFTARTPNGRVEVRTALPGDANVANALAAMAVGHSQGVSPEEAAAGIASVRGIRGRFERIDGGRGIDVYVDYAHTPNALEGLLRMARSFARKRVILLFGEPGRRDRAKRPLMGEIAGRLADKVVITVDCWYEEDADHIIGDEAAGCARAGLREGIDFWRVRDRSEGIRFAVELAEPGDLVLVTGKGHERTLAVAGVDGPWDEAREVRDALASRFGRAPVPTPRVPG